MQKILEIFFDFEGEGAHRADDSKFEQKEDILLLVVLLVDPVE